MKVVEEGMSYYQCKKTQFIIKIYDKGKQYNLPDNVLRFEIKVMRMQYLETKGIRLRYLSDLLNMDIYEPLGNILTEVFEGILFGDNTLDEKLLNTKELETFLRGSNPKTWTPKTGEKERKRVQRLEYEFKGILERHRPGVNFRSVVSDLIRVKGLELSRFYQPKEDVFSLGIIPFLPFENEVEKSQFVPFLHFSYSVNTGHSDNAKVKKCASCRKVLKDNQMKYCSDRCKIEKDERNVKSNDRNNFKKRFKKVMSKPSLFDVSGMVKLSNQQKQWIIKS